MLVEAKILLISICCNKNLVSGFWDLIVVKNMGMPETLLQIEIGRKYCWCGGGMGHALMWNRYPILHSHLYKGGSEKHLMQQLKTLRQTQTHFFVWLIDSIALWTATNLILHQIEQRVCVATHFTIEERPKAF